MKHASLPHHFYVEVDNTYLGPQMPAGRTRALLHGVYGREGQALLTHLILETGAHWSGVPLTGLFQEGGERVHPLSDSQPWGCMGDDISASELPYLEGLRVRPRFLPSGGRHTGIIIDWDGAFSREPAEHKPLSLLALDDGGFALLPNNYFEISDPHFTKPDAGIKRFYRRGETVWWEDDK